MKKETVNNSSSAGVSFSGLLGVAFIVLKLLGKISWPWLWVLAPIWGPIALLALIALAVLVIFLIDKLIHFLI
jgi:hypothetical protein